MKFEEKTRVDPRGLIDVKGTGYIVALVFFPFDKYELDARDERELKKLYGRFSTLLRSKEVQFTCIGFADYRGTRDYNLKLGRRRAESVKEWLDGMFRQFDNYSAAATSSFGESLAAQPSGGKKPSREQMAQDRCVSVAVSRTSQQEIEIPPTNVGSQVLLRRIVGREFYTMPKEESVIQPKTPQDEGWEEAQRQARDALKNALEGKKASLFYGNKEEVHRRRYRSLPRHFRVNEVFVENTYSVHKHIFGKVIAQSTQVGYAWGPPKPRVTVHFGYFTEQTYRPTKIEKETIHLSREEADKIRDLIPPAVRSP